jgi:hypothetical protein
MIPPQAKTPFKNVRCSLPRSRAIRFHNSNKSREEGNDP